METVAEVASTILGGTWNLFLKTDYPGLGVSIAGVAISLLIIRFSIRLFQFLTGFGANPSDYGRAADGADRWRRYQNRIWKRSKKHD